MVPVDHQRIADARFEIIPLSLDNMESYVAQKKIDFVLTTPTSFATLEVNHGVDKPIGVIAPIPFPVDAIFHILEIIIFSDSRL